MQKIINFILGHVTLSITAPPEKALNILMLYNINYWNLRRAEEGITVTIPWSEQRYVRELLTQFSLSHQTAKQGGIPPTILRYRRRPGLFVGFLVFATLLWTANMFVWDIDIYGNESVSDTEILEGLRDAGAYVGAFRPNMNLDEMINTFLLNSESISWITINFMGTTAEVQVVEYRTKETAPPQDDVPSIIVAEREGIVWRYEITGGAVMVQLGQAVQPGQLLVSGIVENEVDGIVHLGAARGQVFAETRRELEVVVPFNSEVREEEEEILRRRSYNIFGRELHFNRRGKEEGKEHEIVHRSTRLTLFSFIELPIWVSEEVAVVYASTPVTLTEEEARSVAVTLVTERLAEEWAGAEILELVREEIVCEQGVTLRYMVVAMEDIARWQPLDILEEQGGEETETPAD